MTKPTSCHYKSVPISNYFSCLVGTVRSESVRFTRGGHSYALCSSTCDHIQHAFMWLRDTVALLAGSKHPSVSQIMVKTICESLKALCQHIIDRKLLKITCCTSKQKPCKSNVPLVLSTSRKPFSSHASPSFYAS